MERNTVYMRAKLTAVFIGGLAMGGCGGMEDSGGEASNVQEVLSYGPYNRYQSVRSGHCIQRLSSSRVQVRKCAATNSQRLQLNVVDYDTLSYYPYYRLWYQFKFKGTARCLRRSSSNVIHARCSDTDKHQHWGQGNDGRWNSRTAKRRWLANDSANGNVYSLYQSNPYNNSRTKWRAMNP